MVSGIPPVGITQIERFLSYDTVLIGVRYVVMQQCTIVTRLENRPTTVKMFLSSQQDLPYKDRSYI
jgi:hypothetical protein